MSIAATILSVVLAAAFAGSGLTKITGQKAMVESAEHFGIPWPRYRLIGVVEVVAAIGLVVGIWVRWIGVAAAVGLVLLMAGAVFFHLRAKDGPKMWGPAAALGVLALVTAILRATA